jgi:hypothetical protein
LEKNNKLQKNLDIFNKINKTQEEKLERDLNWLLTIIKSKMSFNVGSNEFVLNHFKSFHNSLYPDNKKLSNFYLDVLYTIVLENVKKTLENLFSINLGGDIWKSRSRDNYLTITGHFFDENWKLNNVTIAFKEIFVKKTSNY